MGTNKSFQKYFEPNSEDDDEQKDRGEPDENEEKKVNQFHISELEIQD